MPASIALALRARKFCVAQMTYNFFGRKCLRFGDIFIDVDSKKSARSPTKPHLPDYRSSPNAPTSIYLVRTPVALAKQQPKVSLKLVAAIAEKLR